MQKLEREVYGDRSYFKIRDKRKLRDIDSDDEVIDLVSSEDEEGPIIYKKVANSVKLVESIEVKMTNS